MIKNYVKIAIRNLFKQKVYSFINIFGLALGIACCILIGLYVLNEWSYDEFHSKSDRIYRAWVKEKTSDGRELLNTATPIPLGRALHENIPEVERVTYVYQFNNLVSTPERPETLSESVLVVNADFFDIFDFKLLRGSKEQVFSTPSSIVLSKTTARRYFGDADPLQETVSIRVGNEFRNFTVTGLIEDAPANSSLDYSMFIPYANLEQLVSERGRNSWFNIFGSTYVLLQQGSDISELEGKFASMMRGILGEEEYTATEYTIGLQPLTDIHLNTEFPPNLASVSDPVYSYVLIVVALLILIIACVNFMTLSISKSATRAKEVGIRKTIGAVRQHLMYQFWGEALLMTLVALAAGITMSELLLPFFNDLSGTALDISFSPEIVVLMAVLVLVISFLAGIYPALILSGFKPAEVLKGKFRVSGDKSLFRQSMVVFQFALSIALIIGTFTVRQQLDYIQHKNLGYQKDKLVVFESGFTNNPQTPFSEIFENSMRRKELLVNAIGALPEIERISASSFTPVQTAGWFRLGFSDEQDRNHSFHGNIVDADFIPTLGIDIVEGRNFSEENTSDRRRALIVNEALVDYYGWDTAIGKQLPGPEFEDHEIIGVVENFNYESLHTPVEPLALAMSPDLLFSGINNMSLSNAASPRYSVSFSTADLRGTMDKIKAVWQDLAPGTPFDYTFVDQALDSQYRGEERLSRIVTAGSLFAMVIAALGLFGLASLMVVRRTKEIGVRKVMGATSVSILLLINREFTKLVGIAFLVAVPISWYFMTQWLQDFAYRIDPGLGLYALAGLSALAIAWVTVSYQSVKATLINPVESLKSE